MCCITFLWLRQLGSGSTVACGEEQHFPSLDPAVFVQLSQSVHLGAKQGGCLCFSVLKGRNGTPPPFLQAALHLLSLLHEDIGPFVGKMLIAVSRVRKHNVVDEIAARGNESPAFAFSETSALCCPTWHVFLEGERLAGMETQ